MRLQHLQSSARQAPCDVCGGETFELLANQDRKRQPLETVVCCSCGLVSHAEIPSDDELTTFYERDYRREYNGEETPSAYRVLREWDRAVELHDKISPFLRPTARVLEVGAGIGCTVARFAQAGFQSSGIEPGSGFQSYAEQHLGVRIQRKRLEDLPLEPQADLILLVHVLEHLRSPTAALTRIRKLLPADGQLYIEVPNLGAPHAAPGKLFHFAHIYNFTFDTLTMSARKCGFELVSRLTPEGDKNLALLFRCARNLSWDVPADGYRNTLQAVTRHNTWTYHCRWRYLHERIRTVASHRRNRHRAESRLADLLSRLRECKSAA